MTERRPSRVRAVLVSTAISAGVLLAAEGGLRLVGYAPRWSLLYHTFRTTRLYLPEVDASGMQVFRTNPVYRQDFQDVEFPREKGNAFRIMAIGGSAVHGWRLPDVATGTFPALLAARLGKAHPAMRFESINAGGFSWGSFREQVLCRELVRYGPDLLVVMTGNNEVWEYPVYRDFVSPRLTGFRMGEMAERSMLFLWVNDLAARVRHLAPFLPRLQGRYEVLDDAEMSVLLDRFEANIRSIIGQCRAARVAVVFGATPANLKVDPDVPTDWMTGSSRHTPGLPPDRLAAWDAAWREGLARKARGDLAGAVGRFRAAVAVDPGYARQYREMGICLEGLGRLAEAREAYWQHIDRSRRLVTRAINGITRRVCGELGVPFVDCVAYFGKASPGGIPGYGLFVDSMHPNARGHAVLAQAFFGTVDRLATEGRSGIPTP